MGAHWKGCGFDKPGTMLNELRGRYQLSGGFSTWWSYSKGNSWMLVEVTPSGDNAVHGPGRMASTTWHWMKKLMFGIHNLGELHR